MNLIVAWLLGAIAVGALIGYFLAWTATLVIVAIVVIFCIVNMRSGNGAAMSGEAKLAGGMALIFALIVIGGFVVGALAACAIAYWEPMTNGLANFWEWTRPLLIR